jgi:multidrug efflux pump subunit AcrA (membrane-fusion protein)
VYAVDASHTARLRHVEPGVDDSGYTVVGKGLAAGERIVVQGQEALEPDTPVDDRSTDAGTRP